MTASKSTMSEEAAFEVIRQELRKAQSKHPEWPASPTHAAAIVCEESGELIREALHLEHEGIGDEDRYLKEAIQTAAVCVRLLMNKRDTDMTAGKASEPTPRTDAVVNIRGLMMTDASYVSADFARTLERELAAVQLLRAAAERTLQKAEARAAEAEAKAWQAQARFASVFWSGVLDTKTAGDFQQWEKDYINYKERYEATELDAGRYRWLKQVVEYDHDLFVGIVAKFPKIAIHKSWTLSEAIDAALRRSAP